MMFLVSRNIGEIHQTDILMADVVSGTRIDVELGAGWKRKWLKVSADPTFPEARSLVIILIAHIISLGHSVRLLLH